MLCHNNQKVTPMSYKYTRHKRKERADMSLNLSNNPIVKKSLTDKGPDYAEVLDATRALSAGLTLSNLNALLTTSVPIVNDVVSYSVDDDVIIINVTSDSPATRTCAIGAVHMFQLYGRVTDLYISGVKAGTELYREYDQYNEKYPNLFKSTVVAEMFDIVASDYFGVDKLPISEYAMAHAENYLPDLTDGLNGMLNNGGDSFGVNLDDSGTASLSRLPNNCFSLSIERSGSVQEHPNDESIDRFLVYLIGYIISTRMSANITAIQSYVSFDFKGYTLPVPLRIAIDGLGDFVD